MKSRIFSIVAILLIIFGFFIAFYPLSEDYKVSTQQIENTFTTKSLVQSTSLSTSVTSFLTTIIDETLYNDKDFEQRFYIRNVQIIAEAVLDLPNLQKSDVILVNLNSHHKSTLVLEGLHERIEDPRGIELGNNTIEFLIKEKGDYALHYKVIGPQKEIPFEAEVKILRSSSNWTTRSHTSQITIERTTTLVSTATSTLSSTTTFWKPLESSLSFASLLWILAIIFLAIAVISMRRLSKDEKIKVDESHVPSLDIKHCIFCGAKISGSAEYCEKCGKKVKL